MDRLRVSSDVLDNFGDYHHDPNDYELCYDCKFEGYLDVMFCTICNGSWSFSSQHLMDLPSGFTWTEPIPSGCRKINSGTIDCNLAVNMVIS
jgi:hypothetical protein